MGLLRLVPAAIAIGFVSCLPGARAPENNLPAHVLGLDDDPPDISSRAEFGVVFGGPRGKTSDTSQVSILFNRPMRPLETAGNEAPSPVTITAVGGSPPEGSWHWIGTNGLVFSPKNELARATEWLVTVPAGTRALDGSTMKNAWEMRFSTPLPSVVDAQPNGDDHLLPGAGFDFEFDQPVDLAEVEKNVKLSTGAVKIERAKDSLTRFHAQPVKPLPLDTAIEIAIGKDLSGTSGPLPMGQPFKISNRTYGPIAVRDANCWTNGPNAKCGALGSVGVNFSNPIRPKDLAGHVRIDGATDVKAQTWSEASNNYYSVTGKFAAGRKYTLVITAGVRDVFGQILAKDFTFPFETDDDWPQLDIALEGNVLEAGSWPKTPGTTIPVTEVNVASYQTITAPLDEATVAMWSSMKHDFDTISKLAGAKVDTVTTGSPKNVQWTRNLALGSVPKGGRGALAFGTKWSDTNKYDREDVRVVQITDLGISAKMSPFGNVIWVTHISDGKPVGGATVAIRSGKGVELVTTKTDAMGFATIDASKYKPTDSSYEDIIIVKSGTDWAFHNIERTWNWGAYTDYSGELHQFGMAFTDRGIYRPGETIHAKAIVRRELAKGTETPKGESVTVSAHDSRGQNILSRTIALGEFGEMAFDISIPKTAPLGDVSIQVGDRIYTSANVAEYRPAEFKVGVEPAKPQYIRGDKLEVTTRGDYLFGAPMSGGKVRTVVTRGASYFSIPGHEGWITDDDAYVREIPDSSLRASELQSSNGALGAKGDMPLSVPLNLPSQHGTETVRIESEVEDLSRQTIAASSTVVVHPGEFYVAMEPLADGFLSVGTKVKPRLLALEPSGKTRKGVSVHVQLLARTWQSVMRATGGSMATWESKPVDVEVASCDVVTKDDPQSCELAASKGAYYVIRARAKDGRGNPIAASTTTYAVADDAIYGWPMTDARRVDLVADKKAYQVGDTAHVLVKNPWPGAEAIVTVERAGIYTQTRKTLLGSMPRIDVPLTDDLRPNAYVSVHVVRGRVKDATAPGGVDAGAPSYKTGTVELRIDPESRRLKVSVAPKKKDYHPGEEVEADVSVVDRNGKPTRAEITFFAVDEGVLMLTSYKTPDPIPDLTRSRPLAVFTFDSRADLAKLLSLRLGSGDKGMYGGGGGTGDGAAREDFRTTAYFEPHLVAEGGKAHVKFKLPDSLTTYRLMAVATSTDDRFGSADAQITSSRKLMARPALPRFLRAGDTISAGIVVSTKGFSPGSITAEIDAKGLVLDGDAKKTVTIPDTGSVEVRWNLKAERVGDATLAFKVSGGGESDSVRVTRKVQIPTIVENVALVGDTESQIAEQLGKLEGMRDDFGGVDVRLASTAMVGLDDGFDHLIEYPYGCTEQLTSRLVPLLLASDFAKELSIPIPKDVDMRLDEAIAKVLVNQHGDGGFGYWPDSRDEYMWLTAYAMWGLHVAKENGHAVPQTAIDNARRWLRAHFDAQPSRQRAAGDLHEHELGLAEQAFVLDVLAMTGTPDPGYANTVYAQREKMPLFARAMLAHAMLLGKMDTKQAGELLVDVENHLHQTAKGAMIVDRLSGYQSMLDSDARTTAIVLRALAKFDTKSPIAPKLVRGLLDARKGGTWRSTQETAWALLALHDYYKIAEANPPDFDAKVFLGDALVGSAPFHDRSVHATSLHLDRAAQSSGASLSFQVAGDGHLFYEARLKYARRILPTTPLDRGFFVEKKMRALRPEELSRALASTPLLSETKAKGGDLVLIDLVVTTPDPREQVVIEDPLPAGLEAIDTSLATTAQSLSVEEENDPWSHSWYRREVRDDRVLTFLEHMPAGMYHYRYLARATTIGTYVVPPTKAECMYEPETFGRTGATSFEIAP